MLLKTAAEKAAFAAGFVKHAADHDWTADQLFKQAAEHGITETVTELLLDKEAAWKWLKPGPEFWKKRGLPGSGSMPDLTPPGRAAPTPPPAGGATPGPAAGTPAPGAGPRPSGTPPQPGSELVPSPADIPVEPVRGGPPAPPPIQRIYTNGPGRTPPGGAGTPPPRQPGVGPTPGGSPQGPGGGAPPPPGVGNTGASPSAPKPQRDPWSWKNPRDLLTGAGMLTGTGAAAMVGGAAFDAGTAQVDKLLGLPGTAAAPEAPAPEAAAGDPAAGAPATADISATVTQPGAAPDFAAQLAEAQAAGGDVQAMMQQKQQEIGQTLRDIQTNRATMTPEQVQQKAGAAVKDIVAMRSFQDPSFAEKGKDALAKAAAGQLDAETVNALIPPEHAKEWTMASQHFQKSPLELFMGLSMPQQGLIALGLGLGAAGLLSSLLGEDSTMGLILGALGAGALGAGVSDMFGAPGAGVMSQVGRDGVNWWGTEAPKPPPTAGDVTANIAGGAATAGTPAAPAAGGDPAIQAAIKSIPPQDLQPPPGVKPAAAQQWNDTVAAVSSGQMKPADASALLMKQVQQQMANPAIPGTGFALDKIQTPQDIVRAVNAPNLMSPQQKAQVLHAMKAVEHLNNLSKTQQRT